MLAKPRDFPVIEAVSPRFLRFHVPAYSHCAPIHTALLVELVSDQVSSTDDFADLEDTVGLETLQ